VLHQVNYGESSVVTKIYTELFGLQSYMINGVRSKKARIKSNILQPLSVLDMDVYNRDNVSLVDINEEAIENISSDGIKTSANEFKVDNIVFATGFDAMTGALLKMDIRGRDGYSLNEKWEDGARTYLGLSMVGFPNLFTVTGPGSPSVLSNMIVSIEQHVEWIVDCMNHMRDNNIKSIEAEEKAETDWVAHVNDLANMTLFPQANSWYIGANIPGKPRVFMPYIGGVGLYAQKCDQVAADGYDGFNLASAG